MIVVSDTSPITTLLQIGKADLLCRLYGEVLIPEAVRTELARWHEALPEFLKCPLVKNRSAVERLRAQLDIGEAEAIVLAHEAHAELLLIDEHAAREVAAKEGLRCIGLAGVLVEAKRRAFISSLRDVLRDVEQRTTFFLSEQTKNLAIQQAGE